MFFKRVQHYNKCSLISKLDVIKGCKSIYIIFVNMIVLFGVTISKLRSIRLSGQISKSYLEPATIDPSESSIEFIKISGVIQQMVK